MLTPASTIAVIGFGETGLAIGMALAVRGTLVRAWDPQLDAPDAHLAMRLRMQGAGVDVAGSLADAMQGAKLVICTDSTPRAMAESLAPQLQSGQLFLNLGAGTTRAACAEALGQLGMVIDGFSDVQAPDLRPQARRGELP